MRISIIGDIPEESEKYLKQIDRFVEEHKVGTPVILSAGSVATLQLIDKYSYGKGYPSIIFGNILQLAVLNADKIIFVWDGKHKRYEELLAICKKEKKAYMEIMV